MPCLLLIILLASGISSDRTDALIPLLELLAARVSRAYFACSRVLSLAANNAGIRLDARIRDGLQRALVW